MEHNILFHAMNGIGLGHIRRALVIASEFSTSGNIGKIVFLTNSTHTDIIEQAGYITERIDIGIEDTVGKISFQEYEHSTEARLKEIVKKHRITTVVHDTFFIRPFIQKQRNINHFLVLRDSDSLYLDNISRDFPYFQKIFYPHEESEIGQDKLHFLKIFPNIEFTGYVIAQNKTEGSKQIRDTILISPGLWGDLEAVLQFFSHILHLLEGFSFDLPSVRIVFVLWKHADILRKQLIFPPEAIVYDFTTDMEFELQRSLLFLWRWGYNTVNEVLTFKIPALLFPAIRFEESQSNRINHFSKKVDFLHTGTYDSDKDRATLVSLLAIRNIKSLNSICFSGAKIIADHIKSELWKEKVLIFKHIFLPSSEHFLEEEFLSFKKIRPIFIALKLAKELDNNPFLQTNLLSPSIFQPLLTLDYPVVSDKVLYNRFLRFLASFLKKNNIRTIYTPFLYDASFLLPLKKIIPGIRIFSGARGYDAYSFLPKINNPSRLLSKLDGVFTRDEAMRNFLQKNFLSGPENHIRVIRSVLSLGKYTFTPIPISPLRILIGGRFVEKKGIVPLLQLLGKLHEQGCPIETISLVWSGPLESEIDKIIMNSPIKDKIIKYGFLKHEELLKILPNHNCHINYSQKSSNGDNEGVPNLLLENILSGNLIFSTLSGGIADILQDRVTGIVLSGNVDQDTETIISVFTILQSDLFLYNMIITAAHKAITTIFTPEHSSELLESILLNHHE